MGLLDGFRALIACRLCVSRFRRAAASPDTPPPPPSAPDATAPPPAASAATPAAPPRTGPSSKPATGRVASACPPIRRELSCLWRCWRAVRLEGMTVGRRAAARSISILHKLQYMTVNYAHYWPHSSSGRARRSHDRQEVPAPALELRVPNSAFRTPNLLGFLSRRRTTSPPPLKPSPHNANLAQVWPKPPAAHSLTGHSSRLPRR